MVKSVYNSRLSNEFLLLMQRYLYYMNIKCVTNCYASNANVKRRLQIIPEPYTSRAPKPEIKPCGEKTLEGASTPVLSICLRVGCRPGPIPTYRCIQKFM